ncbi:MAG: polyprenyl synthetase family protein [Alphaproteobacteria bacterium]|nr:polyprenyl synthetase family protein [Rhodospirillaceae bacterium]MBT6203085.1 polyprenyl synthetase family protein [Rhodospirillaceae bacterium]MBT6510105.1 polyprenyl synthetase family protein [Rhodospirillaceae bacterium]MDG2481333.1 polyprenyl synthetase family protein [Alphaproteobacteria bacterium]
MSAAVPLENQTRSATRQSFERLRDLVANDLNGVNQVIVDHLQSSVSLIPQLAGHLVASGGKRLRPIMTLTTARMCNYQGQRHINLAACVEFIHTATLLHDDVVDDSSLRRGSATANAVWGNKPSVLVGDFLFSRSFQLMVSDGSLEVLRILSEASAIIAEGEVDQLLISNDVSTGAEAYMSVIQAKTATLFAAASEIGAVVAERSAEECAALRTYGMSLGIAFQLVDDVLDYSALQADLGKAVGDDFRDGKITLPIVLALQRGDDAERAFWSRTLEDEDQKDGDLEHAMTLLARHNALTDAMAEARKHGEQARRMLAVFPDNAYRAALLELVDFCVDREF